MPPKSLVSKVRSPVSELQISENPVDNEVRKVFNEEEFRGGLHIPCKSRPEKLQKEIGE